MMRVATRRYSEVKCVITHETFTENYEGRDDEAEQNAGVHEPAKDCVMRRQCFRRCGG